jgi:hypothetical protein
VKSDLPQPHRADRVSRRRFLRNSLAAAAWGAGYPLLFLSSSRADAASRGLAWQRGEEVFARAGAPVVKQWHLTRRQRRAAEQGRLRWVEKGSRRKGERAIAPVQLLAPGTPGVERLCWQPAPGSDIHLPFDLEESSEPFERRLTASRREPSGQWEIRDGGVPVLQYNYSTVEPGEVLKDVADSNRKYAVARSDYIHPLYGPEGEALTRDWSVDHPHHRGIYWAWPEVDWRGQRGDLHALQGVFARPAGRCAAVSGPVFAELVAENHWKWGDTTPIVKETATLRAYRASGRGRWIDLHLHFEALEDPVYLARRETSLYGGLNVRLNSVREQQISKTVEPEQAQPRRAWSNLGGGFPGASHPAGLAIFQHRSNPDFPGDWVQYPELDWLQPTFPRSHSRYELKPGQPLTLRYRLWVHSGPSVSEAEGSDAWDAANHLLSPLACT